MKKARAFKEMSDDTLKCRSLGHAWDIEMVTRHREDGESVWHVAHVCIRRGCGTTRLDVVPVGTSLDLPYTLSRRYGYPDDYLIDDVKSWGGALLVKRNSRDVLLRRLKQNAR